MPGLRQMTKQFFEEIKGLREGTPESDTGCHLVNLHNGNICNESQSTTGTHGGFSEVVGASATQFLKKSIFPERAMAIFLFITACSLALHAPVAHGLISSRGSAVPIDNKTCPSTSAPIKLVAPILGWTYEDAAAVMLKVVLSQVSWSFTSNSKVESSAKNLFPPHLGVHGTYLQMEMITPICRSWQCYGALRTSKSSPPPAPIHLRSSSWWQMKSRSRLWEHSAPSEE